MRCKYGGAGRLLDGDYRGRLPRGTTARPEHRGDKLKIKRAAGDEVRGRNGTRGAALAKPWTSGLVRSGPRRDKGGCWRGVVLMLGGRRGDVGRPQDDAADFNLTCRGNTVLGEGAMRDLLQALQVVLVLAGCSVVEGMGVSREGRRAQDGACWTNARPNENLVQTTAQDQRLSARIVHGPFAANARCCLHHFHPFPLNAAEPLTYYSPTRQQERAPRGRPTTTVT